MKKRFNILLAVVIAFFILPFGGITALADEKVQDLKDGEYDIIAKALHADKDEASGAAGFIKEDAKLSVKDGEVELTITVPHNEMAEIEGLQIEGKEPVKNDEDWIYQLDPLKGELDAQVQYAVPALNMKHDVPFRFILEGLDDIPVKEEEPKPAPDEREVDKLLTEDDADAAYELEYETDSSATSRQLLNPVKLLEKNDKQYIQIPINERGADYFRSLKINDKQVIWNSITEGPYIIQFELPGNIEDTLSLDMVIQAGPNVMPHDNIDIWFNTDSIKTIKEPEVPEEPEENPEESVIQLDNGSYTMKVSYLHAEEEKSSSMARYMDDTVFLTVNGDKVEVTITVNEDETVTKLQVDGKDAIEKVIDGEKRYETFEFASLDSMLNANVEYQAPMGNGNIHYGKATFRIALDEDSGNPAEASDKPGADINELVETEVELNKPVDVQKGEVINVKGDKNTQVTMPVDLPEGVKVEITSAKEDIKNQGNLTVAGEVYEFDFAGIEDFKGDFELVMGYDVDKYDADQVDIYYYHEVKREWIKQDGKVENGMITIKATHFSTYGVFAIESEEDQKDEEKEPTEESKEIDYIVKHATEDEASAADTFFTKPAQLIERDGETYIQLTIKNWDMIDWLRTEHGEVTIIKENDDSAVVEFKVTGDLSEAINLEMQVAVPGLYKTVHKARLFLDIDPEDEVKDPIVPKPEPKPTTPKPEPKPKEESKLVPDRAFEIDYVVKHATEDRASAADSFFKKPAFLLYDENGDKYIQLIINDWDMIDWLRTEHGEVIVVKENADGSALIQFKVAGDLADDILLSMKVTVPGLYSMEHDARILLDVDSQNEVEQSDFQIIVDHTEPQVPGKPEFGDDESKNKDKDNDTVAPGNNNNNNPQTGDTTSILLYSMLLMGSLIPLAVKLRRRFI